jgi:peptidoglycan/xylan/chitin deacetylase (PgdA/CDA1 family)
MVSRLDDRRLEDEIAGARQLITERTGQPVRTFAYPNGESVDYDRRAIAALQRNGFTCAVTCRHGRARPEDDPFELPRLATSEGYLPLFAARLSGLGREEATSREVA